MGVDSPLDIIKCEDELIRLSGKPAREFKKMRGVRKVVKLFTFFILCTIRDCDMKIDKLYLEIRFFRFKRGYFIGGEKKIWIVKL